MVLELSTVQNFCVHQIISDYLHQWVEREGKMNHSISCSRIYSFWFSSLMQSMAPSTAVYGVFPMFFLSFFFMFCKNLILGVQVQREQLHLFASLSYSWDLVNPNFYLVSLVMCLMLCIVLWKAEKHETQHLLSRSTHLKARTERSTSKASCVSILHPWMTYLGAS